MGSTAQQTQSTQRHALSTATVHGLRRMVTDEVAQQLMKVPGIWPLIATANAVPAPSPETFQKARDAAAWLGSTRLVAYGLRNASYCRDCMRGMV